MNAKELHVLRQFRMSPEQYDSLYEAQDGKCYLCRVATGKTKRLSVDHDHRCCKEVPTCGKCTRGLLCGECNQFISRRMHDDPEVALRFYQYLLNPPAPKVLRNHDSILDDVIHPKSIVVNVEARKDWQIY
jgi:hypothetical protein